MEEVEEEKWNPINPTGGGVNGTRIYIIQDSFTHSKDSEVIIKAGRRKRTSRRHHQKRSEGGLW